MKEAVLSINAGSSSIKFGLFGLGNNGELSLLSKGKVEGIGSAPHFIAHDADHNVLAEQRWDATPRSHESFLDQLLDWLGILVGSYQLVGVGHRIVHGGREFEGPVILSRGIIDALNLLVPLAPLHQTNNLAAVGASIAARPTIPQVACFDTAFHHSQPKVATQFAIPRALSAQGIRRYGFHGLSYEYVARQLKQIDRRLAAGKVIAAHLGNGASLCAMDNGRSMDTTMGFTALEGLMMGTRCGSIDPGVILHLQQHEGMGIDVVQDLLYNRSGLLGVSGVSADMRELLDSDEQAPADAVELFTYRVTREAGALASSLGGLDGLVFTAGIGENSPEVRAMICNRLAWLGVELDFKANGAGLPVISTAGSKVKVRIIPTDEERMIAIHTLEVVRERHLEAA